MILKKTLTLVFVLTTLLIVSQNNVCESASELDIMMELNNIDKCFIESNDNDNSNNNNDIAMSTRSRYVRTKSNLHISNFKKNLSVNSLKNETKAAFVSPKKNKQKYVKYKNLTQIPVLLTLKGASEYKDDLKKALKHYIDENLIYPVTAKRKEIEARVWASFVIDTKGYIKNITTSGPMNGEVFEIETKRLIEKLPNFIPGKLNGEYVNIKYLLTVDFELGK